VVTSLKFSRKVSF